MIPALREAEEEGLQVTAQPGQLSDLDTGHSKKRLGLLLSVKALGSTTMELSIWRHHVFLSAWKKTDPKNSLNLKGGRGCNSVVQILSEQGTWVWS